MACTSLLASPVWRWAGRAAAGTAAAAGRVPRYRWDLHAARGVSVYEPDRKGGYQVKQPQLTPTERMKTGLTSLKSEFVKLGREIKDTVVMDPWTSMHDGDYMYQWKMNSPEAIDQWVLTCDSDNNDGYSSARLALGQNKCSVFEGTLSTRVPKDGVNTRAGYCNIRSPYLYKSFGRMQPYDWSMFTHLIMRVKGDGRQYMLNVQIENYFDVMWNDSYHFFLYTRGGPYWQVAKIPFSKFYLTSKGRIQDKQGPLPQDLIRAFSISICDGNEGDFRLEIDYIGLLYDANHNDTFIYEMYEGDPYVS